ncbi:glycosyl hydrolase family 8 [Rufibacter hautae]|uniref:cellulase n=1 Tax=Rufibacter hautae TaxID=2595005 RepID=A0A5B6TEI8_9BACT|nr:glycosyl hydrolase family 8 [Rufibacter hautae]KAA3438576.1 glycoside hydrolase [Rufibacter hautae]
MKARALTAALVFTVFAGMFTSCAPKAKIATQNGNMEKSGKGAYATKQYRNLFKENGHSEAEINRKIQAGYQQLFQGDSASQAIYFKAGKNEKGPLAYIHDVYNKDVRSEGMSYGMMIAVQMDKKAEFDALWNYAITHMYIDQPGHPSEGYFAWSVKPDGTRNSEGPAPDGEEYFVTALYFASGRWGNGQGIYNYKEWADKILTTMRHHPETSGTTKFGPQTSGPMVNEQHKMILFVPTNQGRKFSDPSYHLPAFYELWALWGPEKDRAFWKAAADTSRAFFQKTTHPVTGLAPDYAHFDGKPVTIPFNPNSHHFAYDSWRTAMNWSVDWAWWQKDSREVERSNRIQAFFASEGLSSYGHIYTLDGKKVGAGPSAGLVSTNAVASLAATHPVAKEFVEALWNLPVPHTLGDRYYGGLLYLMSLLHCSGKFQIYAPR